MRARSDALAADVVVVNHHLFFADVMLRDEGMAELLPACNTVIFDEAHQLPETASLFFGETRVHRAAGRPGARRAPRSCVGRGRRLARAGRSACDSWTRPRAICAWPSARRPVRAGLERSALSRGRIRADALQALAQGAGSRCAGRSRRRPSAREGLGACCAARRASWRRLADAAASEGDDERRALGRGVRPARCSSTSRRSTSARDCSRKQMGGHPRAWIFTSATLAVGEDFAHFCARWASRTRATRALGQPLRLRAARRCSTCRADLPSPNSRGYTEAVVEAALPVLEAEPAAAPSCCSPRCARCAARTSCSGATGRLDLSAAGAGRRLAQRAAGALPRSSATRCWSAASPSGKAWTCAARRCRWW